MFKIGGNMNKIYFDKAKNHEVVDFSGKKTLKQINSEFKGNFVDVTKEREAKMIQNEKERKAINERENLIKDKTRELAISELGKEGKI